MLTYNQMGYLPSTLENPTRLLFDFNWATTNSLGDVVLCPRWPSHLECTILDGRLFVSIQCHYGTSMASQNESHSIHVPLDGELPHGRRTSWFPWLPAIRAPMLSGGIRVRTSSQRRGTSGAIKCKEARTIIEPGEERSIYNWSASTTMSLTWHRSNHLY